MKKWSIKLKVTLWYTLFMTLLVILVLLVLFAAGGSRMLLSLKGQLRSAVSEAVSEMDFDDGMLKPDDLDFFQDGVYLSVYDSEGILLFGWLPSQLSMEDTPYFSDGMDQEISVRGIQYLVYDLNAELEWGQEVWIRGIVSRTEVESGLGILMGLAAVVLPFMVILIALGGYYVTKRAFRPVEQIRKTAEEIAGGGDLSRRIRLGDGKDEIYQLGATFDSMLEKLEKAFEREKQFTSDASHELRTPTSVILAQSEYALKNAETLKESKESLEVIHRQARKMSGLISQLLTLTRADRGKLSLNLEILDVSELLEVTAQELQEQAWKKHINICMDIEPQVKMRGDETMLMRIMINLLQNAISYGRENGHVWLTLRKQKDTVSITVRDDGIGIPEDKLGKIWDRFYQVNPSRERKDTGSVGLGLAMVKWMAEAHGGTVAAKSRLGEGTEFTVKFFAHNL